MSIHISYHFGTELRDHLQTLAKQGDAAVNKAARAIGVYMLGEIQQHFDGQTLWDDSKMPPSKAAQNHKVKYENRVSNKTGNTYRAKLKVPMIEARKTLINTHKLYKSYHRVVTGSLIELGSDGGYAIFHDQGTKYIEARPVLGVNPRNESDIIDEVVNVLKGLM